MLGTRLRRIERCRCGPAYTHTPTSASGIACDGHMHRSGNWWTGKRVAASPGYEEAVRICEVTVKGNDVAGVEALVLDVSAPAFGQDVTLATVPIGVTEAPALAGLVLETQQDALGVPSPTAQREVLLCVLLRDHQTVQLPHVARR